MRPAQRLLLTSLRPSLDLNFLNEATPGNVTFSGGANGTRINGSGAIAAATAPRFDYDPVSLAAEGLLLEEARTNIPLNCLIDGTSLSTQSVTVTNVAHTLSFYGTGTVTLSGTSTAGPLVGSAVYPTRSTLTFTPTAGSLTLTVSGSVQFAKLEIGSYATSFTPTAGAAVTRTIDVATLTGSNFSSWYNQEQGTFVVECRLARQAGTPSTGIVDVSDGTGNNSIRAFYRASGATGFNSIVGGVPQCDLSPTGVVTAGIIARIAVAYRANDFAAAGNGVLATGDTSGTVPAVTQLSLGIVNGGASLNGWIRRIRYYPRRLPNSTLQRLTA